jgi:hypothetical protein
MKLHVMYNQSGRIIAAVRLDADKTTKSNKLGRRLDGVRPVITPGHSSADLDVPSEHAHLTFAEACRQLVVDTSDIKPRLKLHVARQT